MMLASDFKSLYENHAKALWAYVFRLTGDKWLAEDIVQEVFVRFLNCDPAHLSPLQKKSYVYRTATNLVYDHFRKHKTTIRLEDVREAADEDKVGATMDFENAFRRLTPQQRALLWMAYAENSRHDEIAAVLNLKTKSIRVMLFRAKQRLVEIMKAMHWTGDR